MDDTRKVICICTDGGHAAVAEALSGSGWTLHCIRSGDDEPEPGTIRVGIVVLTQRDSRALETVLAQLRRHKHLLLTAILAPDVIADPAVAEFVSLHCTDYQTLPIDPNRLRFALGHAAGMAELAYQTRERARSGSRSIELIGESRPIRALRADLSRVAQSDAPVLLTGESGTGKELVAQAIHANSTRRQGPFVAVNCVALTPTLIHAELFGYEKGAFTGATQRKVGHLEAAHGGTIFLDEIGDLDMDLQALLLRFLEQKTVRRVGGLDEIALDVRVIAATHVDIEAALKARRFREDLYYRLNVLRIRMPALRERPGDPTILAQAFFNRFQAEARDCYARGFEPAALRALEEYSWPGNVRELMNRVRRAVVMADGPLISAADLQLPATTSTTTQKRASLSEARVEAERLILLAALDQTGWRPSKAADLLGVSRATFYRLVGRHGLNVNETGTFRAVPSTAADPVASEGAGRKPN